MALFGRLAPSWQVWAHGVQVTCLPMQLHAVVLATFASVIAPFGGFFASGFKRGFKIKDFGDSIPGHGGMTDRMDCQVVMAVFSYIYFTSYVAPAGPGAAEALATVVRLAPLEQARPARLGWGARGGLPARFLGHALPACECACLQAMGPGETGEGGELRHACPTARKDVTGPGPSPARYVCTSPAIPSPWPPLFPPAARSV